MSTLLTRVIYIFVAFAIVTAIGFSIPALVQNGTAHEEEEEDECPCKLKEYFKLQTKFAKEFGIFERDNLGCFDTLGTTELRQITSFDCDYRIRADDTDIRTGNHTCSARVLNPPESCPFDVAYKLTDISEEELAACRDEIIRVARDFEVTC